MAKNSATRQKLRNIRHLILHWIYYLPALLLSITRVKFVIISYPDRIGHLATEPDNYLKLVALGDIAEELPVCLIDRKKVANEALLDLWKSHLIIIENAVLRKILRPFTRFPKIVRRLGPLSGITGVGSQAPLTYASVLKRHRDHKPLLEIPEERSKSCRMQLEQLGLPADAWFVCIHARHFGWAPEHEHLNSRRNGDISACQLAADEIIKRGGWCIRMGDKSMPPIPEQDKYLDVATLDDKDPWLDIYLCANARFFLGNSSGIFLVSTLFNVPCALANMIPLDHSPGYFERDLTIPKLVRNKTDKLVDFNQMYEIGASENKIVLAKSTEWTDEYKSNYIVQDNSAEEIRDLACDMFDRLEGVEYPEDEARTYERFRALIGPTERMYHSDARFAPSFVRKYSQLF